MSTENKKRIIFVRLETSIGERMDSLRKANPRRYRSISDFVRDAIIEKIGRLEAAGAKQ